MQEIDYADIVFIGYGGGLFATTSGPDAQRWSAHSAEELIAKLDHAGIDRARLYLIVPEAPTCPDHALSAKDANAFLLILGNSVRRGT